jgi:hypothetical protein
MNRRLNAILVSLLSLGMAGVAHGQLSENLELNVFGGGSAYSDKRFVISSPQSTTPIDGAFRMNNAARAGLRVGVYTRGHWSQEFFYSYEPTTAHFIRRTSPQSSLDVRLGVHNYGITGLYYFQESESRNVRPFLSIGVGGTFYRLTPEAEAFVHDPLRGNVPDMNSSNELALNYGFGVKMRTSDWVGFRVDLRGFLGRNPSFGLARSSSDPNATVFPATGAIHNGEASAGIIFYFFKRR